MTFLNLITVIIIIIILIIITGVYDLLFIPVVLSAASLSVYKTENPAQLIDMNEQTSDTADRLNKANSEELKDFDILGNSEEILYKYRPLRFGGSLDEKIQSSISEAEAKHKEVVREEKAAMLDALIKTEYDPKDDFPYKILFIKTTPLELLDNIKNYKRNNLLVISKHKGDIIITKTQACYAAADIITDLFSEKQRIRSRAGKFQSAFDYWNKNKNKIKSTFKKLKSSDEFLEECREHVYKNCKEVTLFSPTVSAFIYDNLLQLAGNVYDMFGGWGDRMIGALCSDKVLTYKCSDLNAKLIASYNNIIKYNPGKLSYVIGDALAIIKLEPSEKYDLIFTSPPYFDYEDYGVELPRSYSVWLSDFIEPLFEQAKRILKPGAHIAIHISNIKGYNLYDDFKKIMDSKFRFMFNYMIKSKSLVPIMVYKKQ